MNLREAKVLLVEQLRDQAEFNGCGIGKDGLVVLWLNDDHDVVPSNFHGFDVKVMVTGEIRALGKSND